jgi:DNA-binding transcriptional LysR family regulator
VLQSGSLSGAARRLDVTQPTIGRHIGTLEKSLGCVLFTRMPTGLLPTDDALALQELAQAMESSAAALARTASVQGRTASGTVRLSVSEVIGVEVMPQILERLSRSHPDLKVELVLSNQIQNLLRREADLAVRMGVPKQQRLIARRIGRIELGLHAHARYLERRGTPKSLADLEQHCLIGFDNPTEFIRHVLKAFAGFGRGPFTMSCDSDVAQLAMIRAGVGIGACQVPVARRDPELVRLFPRQVNFAMETWITMHEDLRNVPACHAVFAALVRGMKQHVA